MKSIQQNLITMLKEYSFRKHLTIVVGMIAIATVLSVVWSLHINGITLASDDPTCGLQEHVHTEACYDWVTLVEDGTEGIDATEGTEEVELVEGTEAVESTEATELTETVVTTEASVSTEAAGASEEDESEETSGTNPTAAATASVETESEANTEEAGSKGTESAADVKEGTESLTEDATEDAMEEVTEEATEEVTEEATESPQPGDIRVANGVTYVYELVCELEEHTHTDECYESDETEEDADVAEESGADGDDDADAGEETDVDEDGMGLTEGVATVSSYGVSAVSDDDDDEEMVSVTSLEADADGDEDEDETASDDDTDLYQNYYYATTVDYGTDGLTSGSNYLVYTVINGNYYVVTADGSLVKCSTASTISEAATSGLYYIVDTGQIVWLTTESSISDYTWTAASNTTTDDNGMVIINGYYITNGGTYMAPDGITTVTTGFSSTTEQLTLSDDFTLTYTFTNTGNINGSSNNWYNYIVEMHNGDGVYLDVRADNYGWTAGSSSNSLTADTLSESWSWDAWCTVMNAGANVTVVITRSGTSITVASTVTNSSDSSESYTITYTATVAEFEDESLTVYLTGEQCMIEDLSYTYETYTTTTSTENGEKTEVTTTTGSGSGTVSTDNVFGTTKNMVSLTSVSGTYGATVCDGVHYLSGSGSAASWTTTSGGALTYYFATLATTGDSYYFTDQVTLVDAYQNQDDSYIVYTKVKNTESSDGYDYYVISVDSTGVGTLVPCTYLGSGKDSTYTSTAEFLLATASDGIYCWIESGSTAVSFKFTNASGSSVYDYENCCWTLTSTDASSDTGTGTYTFYNSENGVYLAPETVGVSETITATASNYTDQSTDGWVYGADYAITSSVNVVIFTVTCDELTSGSGWFGVEIYNSTGENLVIDTASWGSAWYGSSVTSSDTDGPVTDSGSISVAADASYTVTVTRTDNDDDSTATYTVAYSDGTNTFTATATGTNLTGSTYARVASVSGTYSIGVEYGITKDVAGTTNDTTISDTSIDASGVTTKDTKTAGTVTLEGDFDVTYTFYNYGNLATAGSDDTSSQSNTYQHILALNNSETDDDASAYYIQANTIISSLSNTILTSGNAATGNVTYVSRGYGSYNTSSTWTNAMSNAYCTINITRKGNTITIAASYTAIGTDRNRDNGYYTVIIEDDAFDGCEVTLYLTGICCKLTDITLSNDSATYDWDSYGAYLAGSTTSKSITATRSSTDVSGNSDTTGFTASSSSEGVAMNLNGTSAVNWRVSSSGATFYLARSREYSVYFSAIDENVNYGGSSYTNSQFYLADEDGEPYASGISTRSNLTLAAYADATGAYYVDLPYANFRTDYGTTKFVLQGWYDIYSVNEDVNSSSAYATANNSNYYSCYDSYEDDDRASWDYTAWQYGTIRVAGDTVFYGDWQMSDYDIVDGTEAGVLTATTTENGYGQGAVSTNSFVNTKLYDYSDLYDLYSVNTTLTTASDYISATSLTDTWYVAAWSDKSILGNYSLGFIFYGYGGLSVPYRYYYRSTDSTLSNLIASLNSSDNARTAGVISTIATQSEESVGTEINILDYLFGGTNAASDSITSSDDAYDGFDVTTGDGLLGKTYVGEADYLFQYNDQIGYYYYDSSRSAAFYSQSQERFYLYDYVSLTDATGAYGDFIPFTYAAESSTNVGYSSEVKSSIVNYWFGLNTTIDFSLPDEVGTVVSEENDEYGNQAMSRNMVFKFIGDDDVWVYVDDVLILDLGGIHGRVYGEIDFSTGLVTIVDNLAASYYYGKTYDPDKGEWVDDTTTVVASSVTSVTFSTTYEDAGGEEQTETKTFSASDLTSTTGWEAFITTDEDGLYTITSAAYSIDGVVTTYSMLNDADAENNVISLGLSDADKAVVTASGSHTLSMYYLERGARQSNLAVYFNISPAYGLKLSKVDKNFGENLAGTQFTIYDVTNYLSDDSFGVATVVGAIGTDDEAKYLATTLYSSYSSSSAQSTYTVTCHCEDSEGDTCSCSSCTCGSSGSESCQCSCGACDAYLQVYGLRQGRTYYIVETKPLDAYPDISDEVILKLVVGSDGSMTLTIMEYDSDNGTWVESTSYYIDSNGNCTATDGTDAEYDWYVLQQTETSSDGSEDEGSSSTVDTTITVETVTVNNSKRSYVQWAFIVQNRIEYELPSAGSTGIFPYQRAGIILVLVAMMGLLMIALSDFVQRRRMRVNAYKRGYNEEKAGRENRYAGTRDRPQQRNRIYGRDAPASFSDGSQERSRGTGPGTE